MTEKSVTGGQICDNINIIKGGDSMNIPAYAKRVSDMLTKSGYEAYFVGGCVRDEIMGRAVNDYDITTNALPEQMKEVFKGFKTILTGEKHGTVTVVSEGENIEVTTYRIDGEYEDARHPESVYFTPCVKEDLARRDFTINAICFNKEFVDPFGGIEDIKNKIIRTVGESDKRFCEDALRIMRALRFSAVLGFEIEAETKKSIFKNKELLKKVSAERLFSEFSKLIMGDFAENVLLEYGQVLGVFIPEILPCIGFDQKNKYHVYDVYTHIVRSVSESEKDLTIRLGMFFHDIGKPQVFTFDGESGHFKGHDKKSAEIAKEVLTRLKVDNKTKNIVTELVGEHQREIIPQKKYVKRFLAKFNYEFFDLLMKVKTADTKAHSSLAKGNLEIIEKLKIIKNEIEHTGECVSVKTLNINGNDLIKMGITDGKTIGKILKSLLEKVIDGEIENKKEDLLKNALFIDKKNSN